MKRFALIALALVATGLAVQVEARLPWACRDCGCCKARKVCKLVPDVKKTTKYEYCVECEDFCINGRSKCIGTKQVCDCHGHTKCEKIMQPTCCEVRTRAKILKKPVVTEKCGWKCVVETLCSGCGGCCASAEVSEEQSKAYIAVAEQQGILPVSAEIDVDAAPIELDLGAVTVDEEVAAPAKVETQKPAFLSGLRSLFSK